MFKVLLATLNGLASAVLDFACLALIIIVLSSLLK